MPDPIDRLPCQDVVCARGGHFVCHDMPPPVKEHADDCAAYHLGYGGCHCVRHRPDSVEVSEG